MSVVVIRETSRVKPRPLGKRVFIRSSKLEKKLRVVSGRDWSRDPRLEAPGRIDCPKISPQKYRNLWRSPLRRTHGEIESFLPDFDFYHVRSMSHSTQASIDKIRTHLGWNIESLLHKA